MTGNFYSYLLGVISGIALGVGIMSLEHDDTARCEAKAAAAQRDAAMAVDTSAWPVACSPGFALAILVDEGALGCVDHFQNPVRRDPT